jgi:predicted O-methyltransferase YrrM
MLEKTLYPNFEIDSGIGQLSLDERLLLYSMVRMYKPLHCFEVGAWRGCGSTYMIASALLDNDRGILVTSEVDSNAVLFALKMYREFPDLESRIIFENSKAVEAFPFYLSVGKSVDFIFLDGSNDPDEQLQVYKLCDPFFKSGSIVGMHDWPGDKTKGLDFLSTSVDWQMIGFTSTIIFFRKV